MTSFCGECGAYIYHNYNLVKCNDCNMLLCQGCRRTINNFFYCGSCKNERIGRGDI